MKQVVFKPWIGDNYKKGGIFGKRILAIGESFYCSEEDAVATLTDKTEVFVFFAPSLITSKSNCMTVLEIFNSTAVRSIEEHIISLYHETERNHWYNDENKVL